MKTISKFSFGDTAVKYITDKTGAVGFWLIPADLEGDVAAWRTTLNDMPEFAAIPNSADIPARTVDSLIQLKCVGDDYSGGFAQGRTMRGGQSVSAMRFLSQDVCQTEQATIITTNLIRDARYTCKHVLTNYNGQNTFDVYTVFENISPEEITIEMLSSFSIDGITPFDVADAEGRLYMHRFRSSWASEGRHECRSFEDMQLERSWAGACAGSERFGQVGSMPVRGFFPFLAVEDRQKGVFWAVQLAHSGSWQMEVYRRNDTAAISGGLADREFGHWQKTICAGESFTTPTATIAAVKGDFETICQRLTAAHKRTMADIPEVERNLPIVFNEWCTTWGTPTHEKIEKIADRIKDTPIKYLVIDAGWYAPDNGNWGNSHGDWLPNKGLFPAGLKAVADAVRERGLIPGIWFEMETVGALADAAKNLDYLFLKRDGKTIVSGERRFWDFRKTETINYLSERVLGLLESCGFGYLKIDYNETIGIGADGSESQGESLRQHLEGVHSFLRKIKEAMPQLVIENCSSGGHRLEPSMLAATSMSSFSDAHETKEIPVIAANLHNLVLPAQSQVWAVLRAADTQSRLHYSLAATFLGRMCISGEITELTESQFELMLDYQRLYGSVKDIITDGFSRRYGSPITSIRHCKGWQVVLRMLPDNSRAMAVIHSLAEPVARRVCIDLPFDNWKIDNFISDENIKFSISGNKMEIEFASQYCAAVVVLKA